MLGRIFRNRCLFLGIYYQYIMIIQRIYLEMYWNNNRNSPLCEANVRINYEVQAMNVNVYFEHRIIIK